MIIDIHNHIEYKTPTERFTADEFVKSMDEGGIDVAVILGCDQVDAGSKPPWSELMRGPSEAKNWLPVSSAMPVATNLSDEEVSCFCRKYPDRLIGFASIHPDRYRPDLKIERAVKELGLRGVKLYPHAGFYPNDRRLDRVYEKCIEFDIPVMIHTGIKAVRWQWIKYNNPIYVDDVATNFPELKIIICHGGFPWVNEFLAVAYSNPNVYVDITFMDYIEKAFQQTGLVENTLRTLINIVGADRILWGSEGPNMYLPMFGHHGPPKERASEYYLRSQYELVKRFDFINEEDQAKILGGNAARLLKLNEG